MAEATRDVTFKKDHDHEFRYYGAINLYFHGEAVGVVDVWRCRICKVKGTELRAQGLSNLSSEAGFPVLDGPESRWVVFICNAEEKPKFDLLNVHPGDEINHECIEKKSRIMVSRNYDMEDKSDKYHRIECIDGYINSEIDLQIPKRMERT